MIRPAVLLMLLAAPATAHGTLPGAGGFAAGFAHPFLAAEHLLLLSGVGLGISRQGSRGPLLGLLGGLVAGFGLTVLQISGLQPAILTLALVVGGGLAAALPFGLGPALALAACAGLLIGADTDATANIIALAGVTAAVFLIVLNAMALGNFGSARLNGIPLRVAGSWIVAAAILVLAFLLRGGEGPA